MLDPWSPVEVRRTMAASPAEVFAALSDPRTYPDWLDGAQQIRGVDPDFPEPGSAFHHSVGPSEALTVDDSTEVLEVEAARRLLLRVHLGPVDGTVDLLVHPHPAGSEVVFRERPDGWARALTPLLRLLLRGRNADSLRRLEDVVTARRTGH